MNSDAPSTAVNIFEKERVHIATIQRFGFPSFSGPLQGGKYSFNAIPAYISRVCDQEQDFVAAQIVHKDTVDVMGKTWLDVPFTTGLFHDWRENHLGLGPQCL
jgi:hypothetical protein